MNGDKFVGTWQLGLREGNGVIYYVNGSKMEGIWKKDNAIG